MAELYHECGVAALYHLDSPAPSRLTPLAGPDHVSELMPRMLLDLQTRGQLAGRAAIGHVRYATCGSNERSAAQPFERGHGCKWKWYSFAFNGQLANFDELRDELLTRSDYHLTRNLDTEIIMHYLSHELRGDERPDLVQVFANLTRKFDGAY